MVICLERGADLHMAQLMPLPLTVSCFSKFRTGFTFLVLAHLSSPRERAVKRVCVCERVLIWMCHICDSWCWVSGRSVIYQLWNSLNCCIFCQDVTAYTLPTHTPGNTPLSTVSICVVRLFVRACVLCPITLFLFLSLFDWSLHWRLLSFSCTVCYCGILILCNLIAINSS